LNGNTFRALEFDRIRALLLMQAGSVQGRARLDALMPSAHAGEVREALARTGEGVVLLRAPGRQPYHDLPDLTEALAAARLKGNHLEPRVLLDVASFIEGAFEIARRVTDAICDVTKLPREAVWLVIEEIDPPDWYVAGKPGERMKK